MPALNVNRPADLMAKLEYELQALKADTGNSYAAINALRDAYHLREWIWHGRLQQDAALQVAIMGSSGDQDHWNIWVNLTFTDFPVVRELCNGSKHFSSGSVIQATHQMGWDSPIAFWDGPYSFWDDASYYVGLNDGRLVPVAGLIIGARDFWQDLFTRFPQLT